MLWQILAVGVDKTFSYMNLEKTIRVAKARKSEKSWLLASLRTLQEAQDYLPDPLALVGLNAYPCRSEEGLNRSTCGWI